MMYSSIDEILVRHDAEVNAAEAHGIATGMLCIDERLDATQWAKELFQANTEVSPEEYALLDGLFKKTCQVLSSDSFEFDLLLPDDEDTLLTEQAEALCHWCQGFLFGIGYGHSASTWPGNSGEILKDVVEFTKIDTQVHDEEDEQALVEIIEYLRAAVLLLRDDLRGDAAQTH